MERYSDRAIEIINDLHAERLDYDSEYLPLIDCANRCKDYEDAEEQGLLAWLPCKAEGAELFFIDYHEQEIYKTAVTNGIRLSWTNYDDLGESFPLWCIGKTVFLTREEAEAALKGANRNG